MEICNLESIDENSWDEYALNHPSSTFYHQIGWKRIVEKSYRHRPFYILAKERENIRGIFPLFLMKSPIFGTKLVSVPYAPYGGAIGDNHFIEGLLAHHGLEITQDMRASYMELRHNTQRDLELPSNDKYFTMILRLDKSPDVVWQQTLNNKVRNAVKKSLNSDLEISNGKTEDFYKLYSKNMRDLGAPYHSKKFFDELMLEFKKEANILTVFYDKEPISAAVLLYFKDTVISGWAASERKFNKLNPNNLLYWTAIKNACENGYQYFDFGRSIYDSGTYNFKRPWGAIGSKLQYVYYLNRAKKIPDTSQSNLKRQKFAEVWKKMPLLLTNYVGPKLRGGFP